MLKWVHDCDHAWGTWPLVEGPVSIVLMANSSLCVCLDPCPAEARSQSQKRMGSSHGRHDDVLDVGHVASRGRRGRLRAVAALARVHVGRIPIPPVMWW